MSKITASAERRKRGKNIKRMLWFLHPVVALKIHLAI
jgi:hypothetical protein